MTDDPGTADLSNTGAATASRFREWPLTLVLLVISAGLLIVAADHFKRGSTLLAGGVVLALFLRVLLPSAQAGMLVVRSKKWDTLVLAMLALAVSVFAFWVPPPS